MTQVPSHIIGSNTIVNRELSDTVLRIERGDSETSSLTKEHLDKALLLFSPSDEILLRMRIEISSGFTSLDGDTFQGRDTVSEVVFLEDSQLLSVGESCFRDMTQCSLVDMSSTTRMRIIPNHTFQGMGSGFTEEDQEKEVRIMVPPQVTTIGTDVFTDIHNLTGLVYPSTLTSLEAERIWIYGVKEVL
jgi:hypothetical protein